MRWLFCFLILAGFGELGLGIVQSVRMFLYDLPYTEIRGTLNNPGPYSFIVVAILPIAWWYVLLLRQWSILHWTDKSLVGVSILYVLMSCFILPLSMSRTSWVAALIACSIVSVLTFTKCIKVKWVLKSVPVLLVISSVLAGLFYELKRDSADGRILIWKVSLSLLKDHWMTGVGSGHFAGAYGDAQEEYFRSCEGSEREEYLSGAPDYAYNEYLQIWIESGIAIFLCVLIIVGFLLYSLIRSPLREACPVLGCLISILIIAFFSYPLRNVTTCLLTAGIFLLAIYVVWPEKWRKKVLIPILVISAVALYGVCDSFGVVGYTRRARQQQNSLQVYYHDRKFDDIVPYYNALYPFLKNDPVFLFEYGRCLFHVGEYDRSIYILKDGLVYSSDPMFLNIIGRNYQAQGDFLMAEKFYLKASFRIPHRIYPLYRLMLLYREQNEEVKAVKMASTILHKKIKIPSSAVDHIYREAREIVNTSSIAPTKKCFES